MKSNEENTVEVNLTNLLGGLEKSAKQKKAKKTSLEVINERIPTAVEILDRNLTPGTILKYPEKPILFQNSLQSAVKTLAVNIYSTETRDKSVLHKIHTETSILNTNYGSK